MGIFILRITNIAQILGNLGNPLLVEFTCKLNNVTGTTQVDFWMDAAKGVGHRVVHGHSPDNIKVILDNFGWEGLVDYFNHLSRDLMSPHGIPIPFAKEVAEGLGLRPLQAVEWLCLNLGDVLSGGLSIAHSIQIFAKVQSSVERGNFDRKTTFLVLRSAVIKLGLGLVTKNPLTVGVSIVDFGVIAWGVGYDLRPQLTEKASDRSEFLNQKTNVKCDSLNRKTIHLMPRIRDRIKTPDLILMLRESFDTKRKFKNKKSGTWPSATANSSIDENFFPKFFKEAYC